MTFTGAVLLVFAAVHTVWTGFHAPLAAWIAPLGAGLLVGGAWSARTGRPLPRWATALLWLAAAVLAALLVWTLVIVLTHKPSFG